MRHTKQPLDIATVVERIILVLAALMLIVIMSGCLGSFSVSYEDSKGRTLSATAGFAK